MSADLPILYSFRRCPYAMRSRMALRYTGTKVELREVVLRDKPNEMLAASPKGTVPVLVLSDRTVIDESLKVMLWCLARNDPDGWLADRSADVDALIDRNDGEFKHWLDRYKYAERYPERSAGEYRAAGEKFLADLDARLRRHKYLFGSRLGMGDVALMPFVRQFAHVDQDWFASADYPALRRWLEHLKASTLFGSIMAKYPAWRPGDAPTVLG